MKKEDVIKIFMEKYPNGKIAIQKVVSYYERNYQEALVTFEKGKKCYTYHFINYVDLLQKMHFNVIYNETLEKVKKDIAEIKRKINVKQEKDMFFDFIITYDIKVLEKELTEKEKQLNNYINNYIIVKK